MNKLILVFQRASGAQRIVEIRDDVTVITNVTSFATTRVEGNATAEEVVATFTSQGWELQ